MSNVLWHDIECGRYSADLPLWRELAAQKAGDILDVGAGTGRVALDLARRGHRVVALDHDRELLAALRQRALGLPVDTVVADARSFRLQRTFELILVPMQTVQLLGSDGRRAFLRTARRHLAAGGLLACALADALAGVELARHAPPRPDMRVVDGVTYYSRPIALRDEGDRIAIERIREVVAADSGHRMTHNVIHLDRLDAATLERDGRVAGLTPAPARVVAATEEHVGSTVVILVG